MTPGQMTLQRIASRAYAIAIARVKAMTPPLLAA